MSTLHVQRTSGLGHVQDICSSQTRMYPQTFLHRNLYKLIYVPLQNLLLILKDPKRLTTHGFSLTRYFSKLNIKA